MMKQILFFCITVSLLAACRSTRKIQTAIEKKDTTTVVNDQAHDDSVQFMKKTMENVVAGRIDYKTFSAKMNVDYQGTDGKKYELNANLRMQKDSVIWASITAIFGIEGMRALITKDSVKILNKQDKVYTARSVSYLQEITKLPLNLQSLQDILIGNPVFLEGELISYSQKDNSVSLLILGEFFKHLITINGQHKIENSKLDDVDPNRSRSCNLSFAGYENKKGVDFATIRRITVTEKTNLDIKLDIKSYEFNETLSFPFSVPKNYDMN